MGFGPRDVSLVLEAFREKWALTPEKRAELLDSMVDIALSQACRPGTRVTAFRAIVEAARADVEAQKALATLILASKLPNEGGDDMRRLDVGTDDLAQGVARLLGPATEGTVGEGDESSGDRRGETVALPVEGVEVA